MTSTKPAGRNPSGDTRARSIHALHIPVDPKISCSVLHVAPEACALSAAIGGGLLDEAFYGRTQFTTPDPEWYCVYLDEQRSHLPPNERLMVLAARLGWPEEARTVRPDGDALITGTTTFQDDIDVPAGVLVAAWRGQLLNVPPPLASRRR